MNTVTLDIEEYNKLREAFDHRKEVKITMTIKSRLDLTLEGMSVEWLSDGKCWLHLAAKLHRAGLRLTNKIQELERLKKMSRRDFREWQKKEIDT